MSNDPETPDSSADIEVSDAVDGATIQAHDAVDDITVKIEEDVISASNLRERVYSEVPVFVPPVDAPENCTCLKCDWNDRCIFAFDAKNVDGYCMGDEDVST